MMAHHSQHHYSKLPAFDQIPATDGMPHGVAWALWNSHGKRDQIGTLNMLTPDVVLAAKEEIQRGESVAMNWEMHNVKHPGFGRKEMEHEIIDLSPHYIAHDDIYTFNPQQGSQWDGLKHFGDQKAKVYYNNLRHDDVKHTSDNGIHHWSERGGIVTRGILLDYVRYAERKGIKYDAWTRHPITVTALKEIIEEQHLTPRPGDVLIIRSGFIKRYNEASEQQRIDGIKDGHEFIGIDGCEEMIRWLWDSHFAAIAGDTIAMEAWPPKAPWIVHEYSLAYWGQPIGELWDLEKLAKKCEEEQRWSFFLTSAPLNVEGGVASPPNVLAIF